MSKFDFSDSETVCSS